MGRDSKAVGVLFYGVAVIAMLSIGSLLGLCILLGAGYLVAVHK